MKSDHNFNNLSLNSDRDAALSKNQSTPNFLNQIINRQIDEKDERKEGFFKIASSKEMTRIISDFDKFYGAHKLKDIENLRDTELNLIIRKRKKAGSQCREVHNNEKPLNDPKSRSKSNSRSPPRIKISLPPTNFEKMQKFDRERRFSKITPRKQPQDLEAEKSLAKQKEMAQARKRQNEMSKMNKKLMYHQGHSDNFAAV